MNLWPLQRLIASRIDNKGQLFTLDLLLALVPLTLVLGMSANAMAGVVVQIQEYSNIYSSQRIIQDAADALIKTHGTPPNWNGTTPPSVLGLVQYYPGGIRYINQLDANGFNQIVPEVVSPQFLSHMLYHTKVNFLTSNSSSLYTLTGTSNAHLALTNLTNASSLNISIGNSPPSNATQVFTAERRVLYEYATTNWTTVVLFRLTITPAQWSSLCQSDPLEGDFDCEIRTNATVNFTIPETTFASTCFNFTGNFTPWPTSGSGVQVDFEVNNINANGNEMGSGACNCLGGNQIEVQVDSGVVEDNDHTVCGDTSWLGSTNTLATNQIEIDLENLASAPTTSTIFEITANVPVPSYTTNYGKLILTTWK